MSPRRGRDPLARGFPKAPEPFGFTANRAAYVPRQATERALSELLDFSRGPERVAALTGPPGLGKSLLLHLLADRLEERFHSVFVAYGALTPEDLCAYALDRLGSPRTDDPVGVLEAYARHLGEAGSELLLLVDDAGAMPVSTLHWLSDFARESVGSVRCVFAVTDDVHSGAVIAALGRGVPAVRLATPMTPEETADYVEAQLAVGRVSGAVRARFDDATVTQLHELSGGVPRRLHTAAQAVLRQDPKAPFSERATLDDQRSALEEPPERAVNVPVAGISSGIREEVERLWRGAARRGTVVAGRPFFRHPATMVGAFAAAFVAGLLVASILPRLSSRVGPEPAQPSVPRHTAPSQPGAAVAESPTVEAPARAPGAAASERVPVNINATPWATIDVDGEALGETPLAGVPLAAGPHTFRARMPDGRVVERVVEIDAENRFVVFDAGPATPP